MNELSLSHVHLPDDELVDEVNRLVSFERRATSELVSALAELDVRRLYLGQGCSSMFTYCTRVLHLAEHAAYNRIEAARAARRFPVILTLLTDGDIHLSAVRLLAPHLTEANHVDVLREAVHKSKREIEQIVARLQPRPDVPSSVRKLPAPDGAAQAGRQPALQESPPATVSFAPVPSVPSRPKLEPLAPGRYKLQFTVGRETYDKLRRAQDLLRHRLPTGDAAAIFDRALMLLLVDLEKKKLAITERPRTAVRRALDPAMCLRRSDGECGRATAAAADLKGRRGDASRRARSSFITLCRMPMAAKRPSRIWSFVVVRIIVMRQSNGSVHSRGKFQLPTVKYVAK